jgi:thiamine-phosphate pyrophosphorylase
MIKLYRMLDANYNRLREALRLLEDIQRYIFDDRELSYAFKELRHNLRSLYLEEFVKSRDILNDVSRDSIESELKRSSIDELIEANFSRAFEASRVLEEGFKLVEPNKSAVAKEIRYSLYELHRKVALR